MYQNQGIYEKMNELLGDNSWAGLLYRAVQFTFPNDRALFVTRMGDIPYVKNACNEKDNLHFASWMYVKQETPEGFFEDEGYHFPKRLLDKAFNPDGSLKVGAPTFRETVKTYWETYHQYKNYRNEVIANSTKKYAPAKHEIPLVSKVLPDWFHTILDQTISKAEGVNKELYMKSELFRLKLNALIAFEKMHNMELQAHFAPVGLMFNKGVLSDWDQYQDQTIWDRIKETGKDLFYRFDYSSGASHEQKRKEEKAFVEGEGKNRMVKTNIANTAGIKKWVDQAKEEIKVEEHWYTSIVDWWNGDKSYDGSGWAHGARQSLANAIGFTDGNIDNLFEAGIYSMLQSGEVDVSNSKRLIKKINEDPEFVEREKLIAEQVINNPKYLRENFDFDFVHPDPSKRNGIQLGGKRAKGDMLDQFKNPFSPKYRDTWKVAANELTWLLRSINLFSKVRVFKNGKVQISHKFEDQFDLRASGDGSRSIEYDVVSIITGFLYHDIAGGNDSMKVKGNWSNKYSKEDIDWKANGDERIKKMMENTRKEQDSLRQEYDRMDEYNRTIFPFGN